MQIHTTILVTALAVLPYASLSAAETLDRGPGVGERIPSLQAADQDGRMRTFEDLRGPKGLLLLFHRSADWCHHCKGQLVELESQRQEFEGRGIHVAALSYDSVEVLKTFADRASIGFPLLSDPGLRMIQAFGLLNPALEEDDPWYGFAYAGYFVLDQEGTVTSRYFNEKNNDRATSAGILIKEFDATADQPQGVAETPHLTLRWSASNTAFRPGQRGVLVLDVELPPGMHVYSPDVEGYIPIAWTLTPPEGLEVEAPSYPHAEMLYLAAIQEELPVYEGSIRILRDLHVLGSREFPLALQGKKEVVVEGLFRYQACDADRCYRPASIPLRWTLKLAEHDRIRVPESLRRGSDD